MERGADLTGWKLWSILFWQQHIRADTLRRLHLVAQATETFFVLVRPLAAAANAFPASLHLGLRPTEGGLIVDVLKRKGPARTKRSLLSFNSHQFFYAHMAVLVAIELARVSLEVFRPRWSTRAEHGSVVLEWEKLLIADAAAHEALSPSDE